MSHAPMITALKSHTLAELSFLTSRTISVIDELDYLDMDRNTDTSDVHLEELLQSADHHIHQGHFLPQ